MLALYLSTLEKNGVGGYTANQCYTDYRLSMLEALFRFVVTIGSVGLTHEQQAAYYDTIVPRFATSILDLNGAELLQGSFGRRLHQLRRV